MIVVCYGPQYIGLSAAVTAPSLAIALSIVHDRAFAFTRHAMNG